MFANVFLKKMMMMFLTGALMFLALVIFKIVTKILRWKLMFKVYNFFSYALMWNLPVRYLQETTIDLFIAAFWTIRMTFFE